MNSSENPYESPRSTEADLPTKAGNERLRLLPVAIGLLVPSILHIIGWLFYATFVYSIVQGPDPDPEEAHHMTVMCMYYGITVLYSLLLISGAFSMLRRGSYLWALTTCILAVIPVFGPCYFLAIPFGIWGILLLRRPEVRDSFARI